ncbi:MAG: tetratricopeptide repeat protein, partial [Vulcanimicrobiota bacterium]
MPLRFFGRNKWQKELAAGVEALEKGDFPAAEAQLIGAMERAEQMGPDNLAVADTAFALARLYTAQKRLTEARVNDQRAFTHRLEEMGAQDPKTVLSYLALMEYPQPPEYQEEGLLRATLALAQERHGEKDWRCARILSLILGKLPPASLEINGLASQAEAICRHMFGEARAELVKAPDVGGALGDVLKELGHIPAAAVFYSFSARYQEEISGAKSEGAAVALFKLGASLEKSGQSDQALAPLRRSLEIQALKFPSDHEMTRATVNLMALSLSSLGHTEEAGEYFARALEWIDPAHHEARARCLLGLLQAACLDPKKSRDRLLLTDQIVNLAPSLTGPALEYLAQGFRQSATLLSRFWLDAEARGLLEKALEWSQRARGTHDPEVARVHFELARLAHHRGSSQKAEELASKAMMVDDSAPLQIEEGLFLAQRGRWEDATKATQIAIKLLRAEEANPHTGELYMRLAEAQLASVQLDAAGRALRKAYELLPERRRNLAELCMGQLGCMRGSLVEGAKMMSSVLSRLQQLGDFPYQVTLGERDLAAAYYLGGRIDLAETHIERAIESLPPDHPAQAELGSLSARIAADQGRAYEARNKLKLAMQLLDAVTQRGEARRVEALVWAAHLHCDLGLDAEVGRQLCLEGLETTGFPSARMTIFPFPDASLPFLAGLVALHERQDEAKQAKIRAQVLLSRAQAVFEPGDPRLRLCKLWAGPGLEPQESAFVLQALREELARQGDQPRIWEQRALRGCAVANLRLGRVDDALSLARRGLELGKDDRLTDLIRGLEDPSSSPAPDDEIATPEPEPVAAEAVAEPEPVELELVRERAVEVEPDRGPEVVTESETLEFETLPRPEEFVEPEVAEEPESAEPEVAKEPEPAKLEVVTESETLEFEALPIPEEFVEPEVAEEPEPAEPEVAEEPEPVEAEVAEEPEPVEAEVAEEPEPVEAEVAYESTEEVAAEEPEPVEVEVAEEPEPVEAEVAEEPEPAEPEVAEEAEPVEPEVTEEAEPVEAEVAEEAEPAPPAQPDPFQLESVVEALEEDPPEAEAVAAAVNDCVDRYGHASHETVKVLAHFASLYPPESDEAVGYDSQAMELFGEWIDENPKSDLPDLASELAGKSQQRGRLESALGWYARAMQWAHAKFGPGSSESAEVLLRLGEIYEQAEQLEDAEGVYREALVLLESWYGLRSSRLLPTLASLARVSLTRGEFEAATEFLERQSKLLEGPVQTVERAQVLCDLMTTAHRCGEFERSDQARQGLLKSLEGLPVEKRVPFAEQLIEHGRYLQEEFWDPRASEEILSTTSRLLESASPEPVRQLALIEAELAVDYHFKGLEAKAQDSVARARSLTHDLEPAEQLAVLVRLSEVAAQMGAAELARELADRCLELEVTGSGKRSAAASKALLRVANLDLDAYRLEAAETAVAMARSGLAAEDQPQASYLEAQALTLLGRFDEAERIFLELCEAGPLALQARRCLAELCLIQDQFERALEQLEFTVDDAVEHPQDALDLEVKGRILLERGLLLEAGPYVEKAMQIVDGLVQRDDPRRARFLSLMSRLQWMRGEYHEAAELAVEAQDLKAPPTISLHTGLVGLQLAEALVLSQLALGQVKAAERTAESAHLQASEYFGEDDINTHRVLDLLARVALAKGDTDQAESHWTEAIDMARPKLGDEHSFMARCLLGLARLSLERKEWGTARTYAGEARRLEEQARGESFQLIEASLVLARAEEHFDLGEAEYLTDAALDQCGDLLGADHPLNEAIAERLEHINNLLEHSISDEEAPMPRAELAAPEDEEEPQVAEEPAAEEEPEVAEEPVAEEEPQVAEEPAAEEEPEVAEEPAAEEEPEVAEEPVNEEEPQVAEEP